MSSGSVDSEASKPSMSSNTEDVDAVERRFANLCEGLAVDEDAKKEAMSLLKDIKNIVLASSFGTRPREELEKYCFAFVLYCEMKLSKGQVKEERKGGKIGLFQILRGAKLKVDDFFKEALQFSFKVGHILGGLYGVDWEERIQLKQSENMVKLLTDASKFYDKAFRELFSRTSIDHQAALSSRGRGISEFHYFGWLLFLALRNHLPELFKDLVSCVHGLVAILAILIIHVPTIFRNLTIQDSSHFVKRSEKGIDVVASLCHTHHTSEDRLKRIIGKAQNLIVDIMNKKPFPASECNAENLDQINTDGLTYFKDLLDEKSLQSSVLILEKHYDDLISNQEDLDERVFVQDWDNLLGTESSSGGATSLCSTRWKFETLASPTRTMTSMTLPHSPSSPANGNSVNKIVQMTPVSTAMTTAKWLRDVISPLSQKPSSELERFLSSCDKNTIGDVTRRANIILEAIFPSSSVGERSISGTLHYANSFDTTWAKERKMEALKLYYKVLEAICKSESQLLNGNNLTSLLSNERFHRCMLACSAELVLATHKTVIMMFPVVLETTGLTAFDLSKVIESFVRHEETLPRELKRHLNSLEEQLLESMAWEKGSSLYNSLIVARPAFAQEINHLGLLAEPMLSLDEIAVRSNIPIGRFPLVPSRKRDASPDQNSDARSPKRTCTEYRSILVERNTFTSPVREHFSTISSHKSTLLPLQSTFASPTQPNPVGGEACAEIGIKIFFSKILKLAAIRIRSLCERLRQSQQTLERVYSIFQLILNQQTALFFNRHIDQLILCCLYGVAKVSILNLTFKEIVNNYRKEPQCKLEVFRSVFVSRLSAHGNGGTGVDHVDIITFYNEIFIPTVKPLLVGLAPAGVRAEDRNSADSQIPGSPKVSPFSNLPDMSPKKVSAAHNVYVSPLRQSKMDALLSPSSRSYYACIGESTHAYQSPSKDLAAINNRLNFTGRRTNGRINFDIVSDSVVAGSLGYQNGSSASSDAAATFNLPMKHEQPQP
ncbi:retinoblastoma-related protein-like [Typha angustifolia]|uniref:retinoblastoma-related protein-like n=1 Tax=Typha angustifolia TaxID=59011 RepID=UPI003C2F4423